MFIGGCCIQEFKCPRETHVELGLQVSHPMWVWGLNSGPQEEQHVLLTTEPYFQGPFNVLYGVCL